jgi:hypothetical protein
MLTAGTGAALVEDEYDFAHAATYSNPTATDAVSAVALMGREREYWRTEFGFTREFR